MPGLAMAALPLGGEPFGVCSDFERPALESSGRLGTWCDFPMWIYVDDQFIPDNERPPKSERTEYYDPDKPVALLAEQLKAAGADRGLIGLELGALPVPLWTALKRVLPKAEFVDAADLFYQARAVKNALRNRMLTAWRLPVRKISSSAPCPKFESG